MANTTTISDIGLTFSSPSFFMIYYPKIQEITAAEFSPDNSDQKLEIQIT